MGVWVLGSPGAGSADAGEDWGDDLIAQGEERGDGPRGLTGDVVAAGPASFDHEVFAAQLAHIVAGLPERVGVFVLPGPGEFFVFLPVKFNFQYQYG